MGNDQPSWPEYLAQAMNAAGFRSAAQMARDTGVSQSVLARWLRGETQPDIDTLRRLAAPLNIPLLDLLVASGVLSPAEAGRTDLPTPPRAHRPRTFDEALDWTEDLSPAEREIHHALYRGIREGELNRSLRLTRKPRPR